MKYRIFVHPMEEDEGFRRLLALAEPTYTLEQIAAKVGKTPSYIATRLKLTDLCDDVAAAFFHSHIGVGHALLLANLPAEMQTLGLIACFKEVYTGTGDKPAPILLPVHNLRFWIETNVLLLSIDAPFDKRNAELVRAAGSRVDCPKRTGITNSCLPTLANRMPDPSCYRAKVQAHIAAAVAAKSQLVQISTSYRAQAEGGTVLSRSKYVLHPRRQARRQGAGQTAEFKTCKDTIPAMIADGQGQGTVQKVCTNPICRVHHPKNEERTQEGASRAKWKAAQAKQRREEVTDRIPSPGGPSSFH